MPEKCYLAIDLKSFYASVECVERGLDPLSTNLVVADQSRTEKTICLAVSPSLKAQGISGRARLFEVVQRVKEVNAQRRLHAPGHRFTGRSWRAPELEADASLELNYLVATPRMALYMEYSTRIYSIYMNYVSPEDMHVYSIDEVFMDVTDYLAVRGMSARDFAKAIMGDVLRSTGITATAGIGPNLYLSKIAMDVYAKHVPPGADGERIAALTERSYREVLWDHRPLTDFWRLGPGYARKLEAEGLYTMGDIARRSLRDEESLYRLFGVNAELLIDHAWGWEPCTIRDIRSFRPRSNSISVGQVLQQPYSKDQGRIILREMTHGLVMDLLDKGLLTDQIVLTVGYEGLRGADYRGPVETDRYGRRMPKMAHGSENLPRPGDSTRQILEAALRLYDRIVDKSLEVRRMYLVANRVIPKEQRPEEPDWEQLDLFTDYDRQQQERQQEAAALEKEQRLQQAMLAIQKKHGKNAILHGTSYEEGATGRDRNRQIGGHKA